MSEITKGIGHLLPQIRELIVAARHAAARTVDTLQVVTNYKIGRLIVEHEQAGAERARYGKALLKELSASLTTEFGKGFSQSNLEYMRRFYLVYRDRSQPIGQTLSSQLAKPIKSQTVSGKSQSLPERIQSPNSLSISETLSGKSTLSERFQHLAAQFSSITGISSTSILYAQWRYIPPFFRTSLHLHTPVGREFTTPPSLASTMRLS